MGSIDELVDLIMEETQYVESFIASYVTKNTKKYLDLAYDDIILQFYSSYPPKKYIRTDTQHSWHRVNDTSYAMDRSFEGINLYRALQHTTAISGNSISYHASTVIDPSGIKGSHYKIPKEAVFQLIYVKGVRFPATKNHPQMSFTATYPYATSNPFGITASGTPMQVMLQLKELFVVALQEEAKKELRSHKFNYITIK